MYQNGYCNISCDRRLKPNFFSNSNIKNQSRKRKNSKKNEELIKELQNIKNNKNNNNEVCWCGNIKSWRRNFNVFVFKSTQKEDYEAAFHFPGTKGVVLHFHNKIDNFPHFYPKFDVEGKKNSWNSCTISKIV